MPLNVARFETLYYMSLAIGVLNLPLALGRDPAIVAQAGGILVALAIALAIIGIIAGLVWLIARKRKNWARVLLAVLTVVGLPLALLDPAAFVAQGVLAVGSFLVQTALQLSAIYLVFTGDAPPWFQNTGQAT